MCSKSKMPTLCIVDSDRKYGETKKYQSEPESGSTWTRVRKKEKDLKQIPLLPPFSVYPLHVHEVENLIPTQALSELVGQDETLQVSMQPGLNMLEKLKTIDDGKPLLYYDMKKGFPYMKTEPQREYWFNIIKSLGGTERDLPPVTKEEGKNPATIFFPPVCNNKLLERTIKLLNGRINQEMHMDDCLAELWNEIGLLMLTWGCANLPQSA